MRKIRFGEITSNQIHSNVREVRRCILPIIVINKGGIVDPIGTCFVVTCTGKECIAFTVKHNIDYIMHIDGEKPLHSPSTPKEFQVVKFSSNPVNIEMHVAYYFKEQMIPCQLVKSWFPNDGPDIAVLLLRIPPDYPDATFTHKLNIDSKGPQSGDEVWAYGYLEMKTKDKKEDSSGVKVEQVISVPLKYIKCSVNRCFSYNEHRLVKWPCFEVDKALDSGMSGGPIVYIKNNIMYACGIVASSPSFSEEAIGSKIYPATIIRVDTNIPVFDSSHPTLLECIKKKFIVDVSEAHKHVLSNGMWSDLELANIQFDFFNKKYNCDGVTVNSENLNKEVQGPFKWLSNECLQLGQINKHNGDNASYFLISKELHDVLDQLEKRDIAPKLEYIKEEQPYIWFKVSDQIFHFFVLDIVISKEDHIKILADAHLEKQSPVIKK